MKSVSSLSSGFISLLSPHRRNVCVRCVRHVNLSPLNPTFNAARPFSSIPSLLIEPRPRRSNDRDSAPPNRTARRAGLGATWKSSGDSSSAKKSPYKSDARPARPRDDAPDAFEKQGWKKDKDPKLRSRAQTRKDIRRRGGPFSSDSSSSSRPAYAKKEFSDRSRSSPSSFSSNKRFSDRPRPSSSSYSSNKPSSDRPRSSPPSYTSDKQPSDHYSLPPTKPYRKPYNKQPKRARPDRLDEEFEDESEDLPKVLGRFSKSSNDSSFQRRPEKDYRSYKTHLREKAGGEAWNPRTKLSPDTMAALRTLHAEYPEQFTPQKLHEHFGVSLDAIKRILKSSWKPSEDEEDDRRDRWEKRGKKVWSELSDKGHKPPRKWRDMGVGAPKEDEDGVERWKRSEHKRRKDWWETEVIGKALEGGESKMEDDMFSMETDSEEREVPERYTHRKRKAASG